MKTENKAIIIKGIVIPDYKEPKGESYYSLIARQSNEIAHLNAQRSTAQEEINKIEEEKTVLNLKQTGKSDRAERYEFKRKKKELEKQIKSLEEVAYMDVQKDIDTILNSPELELLEDKAKKEYLKLHKQAEIYNKELDKAYAKTKKDINRFLAGIDSDSYYRMAAVRHNRLKN
ncbi:hypothetical protein [Carnobacterium funditum]|uniref:hypothetical protein n=1 Tax=Carnobacterium funditum TaxID=2752 RepID=UPI00055027E6|nr:hypothetical protein [Carnobacterium funditum]